MPLHSSISSSRGILAGRMAAKHKMAAGFRQPTALARTVTQKHVPTIQERARLNKTLSRLANTKTAARAQALVRTGRTAPVPTLQERAATDKRRTATLAAARAKQATSVVATRRGSVPKKYTKHKIAKTSAASAGIAGRTAPEWARGLTTETRRPATAQQQARSQLQRHMAKQRLRLAQSSQSLATTSGVATAASTSQST